MTDICKYQGLLISHKVRASRAVVLGSPLLLPVHSHGVHTPSVSAPGGGTAVFLNIDSFLKTFFKQHLKIDVLTLIKHSGFLMQPQHYQPERND